MAPIERKRLMFDSRLAAFTSMLVLTAALHAQTNCPPLPEGAPCDQYHYHLSVWNIESHTYEEVAVTRPFVSAAACEKARGDALRENTGLADFIKTTKIDTSMMPNRFGKCHCDRTQERSSAVFLNAKQRIAQLRVQQDAAWSLRERLLGQSVPGVGDRLNAVFGRPPAVDRFLRDTMPPRLPAAAPPRAPVTLLESTVGSSTATPAIAASLSLVPVSAPPASPVQAQPAAPKTPVEPDVQPPPPPPPPVPEPHPPAEVRNR
jgi:hypothetical protein